MAQRIGKDELDARLETLNMLLGTTEHMQVGHYQRGSAYGGHRIEVVISPEGGIRQVTFGYDRIGKAYDFVSGMIEGVHAARAAAEEAERLASMCGNPRCAELHMTQRGTCATVEPRDQTKAVHNERGAARRVAMKVGK